MNITGGRLIYCTEASSRKTVFDFSGSTETDDFAVHLTSAAEHGGKRVTVTLHPKKQLILKGVSLLTDAALTDDSRVFLNGFQTWTESREFALNETIPKLRAIARPIMRMYGDYEFYRSGGDKLQSFTYTTVREDDRISLIGSLCENTGYTIFEYSKKGRALKVIKDCAGLHVTGSYCAFDLYLGQDAEDELYNNYFKASGLPAPRLKKCSGWTSWYNYYTRVTQTDVLDNLEAFHSREIPIDIIQIDDGYQHAVGDWLMINDKFPDGMKHLADRIKACGYQAGLWLAPLICEKRSRLCKEHPEWVLKKAGFNPGWSGFFYVLDFYNEEVRAYLRHVFDVVLHTWGYDMVKLDFLYAASLIERPDKTRGQVMYEFMQFLREITGEKMILGCGVPLGCAFGLTDACRIGSDVALTWEDNLPRGLHYRERTSTINSLTSTVGRRQLNGRAFLNDPDVFILRQGGNTLTPDQKYTLFLLNCLFGGLVFTSDNINEYSEEEMALYLSSLRFQNRTVQKVEQGELLRVCFTSGTERFVAVSNLSGEGKSLKADFTGTQSVTGFVVKPGDRLELRPYQSRCFAVGADSVSDESRE